jgi:hypothetical protein
MVGAEENDTIFGHMAKLTIVPTGEPIMLQMLRSNTAGSRWDQTD